MTARLPLTEAQAGIWYAQRLDPGSPAFNTGQVVTIDGPLEHAAFAAAVARTIDEAQVFALRIEDGADGPRQWLDPAARPTLALHDLRHLPLRQAEALARDEMARDQATPVDLAAGGLAAVALYLTGPDRALWYLRAHHLALDGYGTVLVTQRIAALYAAALSGKQPPPPLAPFARAVEADAAYRAGPDRTRDAAFWRAAEGLAQGAPDAPGPGPGAGARPATAARSFDRARLPVPDALARALTEAAQEMGVPWPDLLTALASAYLARFAEDGRAVLGVPHMGRMGSPAARTPCTLVNILPLALTPDEDAPLAELVRACAAQLAAARRHGRYRAEALRRDLGLIGGDRRLYGPLVNILPFDALPRLPGTRTALEVLGAGSVDDITFAFRGDPARGMLLEVDSNPLRHSRATAAAHGPRLLAFAAAALQAGRLAPVPLAAPEEVQDQIARANATAHPVPETTLTALLDAALAARPEAPAVTFGETTLDAGALDRRSAALAGRLAARGIGPGALVAVDLPRGPGLIVALIAVLRAGAAYLPLNPDDPPARKAQVLAAARPALVVARDEALPGAVLDPARADGPRAPLPRPGPADPAYVIFTSGSTGAPKGVVVSHRAIVNRLLWMRDRYGIGTGDRILQKTPISFDVSVWELFLPAIAGAELVLAPPGTHRDPRAIAALIRRHDITALHFVPSMLDLFLAVPEARGLSPRRVFTSGEALRPDQRDRFHRVLRAELHNLYGPTEAAVDVTHWAAEPDDRSDPLPIGHPVWNTRLYILDPRRRPLPAGMPGRLWIAGRQVAQGYLGRPDLTAERFLPDPFDPGGRMYDSGDLALRRPDGALVYLGRADAQVKIRGVRIEPAEVEAVLAQSAPLAQVAVLARDDLPGGGMRLVAYAVPAPGAPVTVAALREIAARHLPDAMRPAHWVLLPALPLNASGKLDRRALPAPEQTGAAPADPPSDPPSGTTARAVAQAMQAVLGLPHPPGAGDGFFALGGDSLSATRLLLRLADRFGTDPGLGALFADPTVAGLAAAIEARAELDAGTGPLLALSAGVGGLPPLYCIHPAGGLGWCYRGLAAALPDRRVVALQSPALAPETPLPTSILDLAGDYLARIRAVHPGGPLHLCGWSVGGIIAHAIAARLPAAERGALALIDAYPSSNWRAEPEPDAGAALRALLAIAGHDPDAHPELTDPAAVLAFLRARGSTLGLLPAETAAGVIRAVQGTNRLIRAHAEPRLDGPLLHFTAAQDHAGTALSPVQWHPYATTVAAVPLPCRHAGMLAPGPAARIAARLAAEMAAVERAFGDSARRRDHASDRV